ncbi:MAG: hypothetical protein NZ932_04365 [Candidatus Bathyarchaeota archaeon]|nr:hypothetical protein [Candidatus Bathyarchaeota archaeon]
MVFVAYLVITYPRVLVCFSVSFTVGADIKRVEFEVPFIHKQVKVEVRVQSGNALWAASILDGETVVWRHAATQSGQTTYASDWIKLAGGRYNFTFATASLGSLEAEVKIMSKGGFW